MKEERLFKIYYGENKNNYVTRYLKESDIIDGYLSEAKAFDVFFTDMVMCNNIYKLDDFMDSDILVSGENEDGDYVEEYQFFVINTNYDEEITTAAVEKMGNTLYYLNNLELHVTGITDLGTSRKIIPTDLKVEEVK